MKFKLNVWFIEVTFIGMQISQFNRISSKYYAKYFHKISWITHIHLETETKWDENPTVPREMWI